MKDQSNKVDTTILAINGLVEQIKSWPQTPHGDVAMGGLRSAATALDNGRESILRKLEPAPQGAGEMAKEAK